jgi:hypothetical protein
VKGILADVNIEGHVDYLMALVRAAPWIDLWQELGLTYATFADVGLDRQASDADIWQCCQREGYLLITDNRNHDSANSLEATIRAGNTDRSLPVLTIGNTARLRHNHDYAAEVVVSLMRTLLGIEELRGAGRLYLP